MADAKKLHATMDYIEAHPDKHCQPCWQDCFAGLTLKMGGYTLCQCWAWKPWFAFWRARTISEVAMRELGLGPRAAARLFDGSNTVGQLREAVEKLAPTYEL